MIRIPCPWCGLRNADEFAWHGELARRPDPATATPEEWRQYLFVRDNAAGWTRESWYHRAGCRRWLVVERDTVSGDIRAADDAVHDAAKHAAHAAVHGRRPAEAADDRGTPP